MRPSHPRPPGRLRATHLRSRVFPEEGRMVVVVGEDLGLGPGTAALATRVPDDGVGTLEGGALYDIVRVTSLWSVGRP